MSLPVPQSAPETPAGARRIVVAEDDPLLSDLLGATLRQHFAPTAVQVFRNGTEALRHCLREPVDLLFTDLGLPDLDGRELIQRVRARNPPPRVLVLTGKVDAALPGELIALGVAGLVDKAAPLEHAVRAVERVLAGGMYFIANVAPVPSRSAARPKSGVMSPALLTPRDREIARLVAGGFSSKEIAAQLGLSARTVENDRARLMRKIGVTETVSLARWCFDHGLA